MAPQLPGDSASEQAGGAEQKARRSLATSAAPQASGKAAQPGSGHGPISQLQEFVQSSRAFPVAHNRQILQWTFHTRMVDAVTLEFRATVAFLLEGVPHHTAGPWRTSKKLAQRATAEQALRFFVDRWGSHLADVDAKPQPWQMLPGNSLTDVEVLEAYCEWLPHTDEVRWQSWREDGGCKALAEVRVHGVRHTFPGAFCDSEQAAREDAAQRILWYFGCPGYEDTFDPDPSILEAKQFQAPPEQWGMTSSHQGSQEVAERKTTLMRVQNRLQRVFAKALVAGQSVWDWSYESTEDSGWPPLMRATVDIPVANKSFVGNWTSGQREAQLDTCRYVVEFLDSIEGSP